MERTDSHGSDESFQAWKDQLIIFSIQFKIKVTLAAWDTQRLYQWNLVSLYGEDDILIQQFETAITAFPHLAQLAATHKSLKRLCWHRINRSKCRVWKNAVMARLRMTCRRCSQLYNGNVSQIHLEYATESWMFQTGSWVRPDISNQIPVNKNKSSKKYVYSFFNSKTNLPEQWAELKLKKFCIRAHNTADVLHNNIATSTSHAFIVAKFISLFIIHRLPELLLKHWNVPIMLLMNIPFHGGVTWIENYKIPKTAPLSSK